ncbi:MAG: 3-oxoacyl-[acyl-carrier-protein] reductase [Acidimicrobiia bacterium]|nr:3-oxoacyl-[acyl-carrier-protein] reductase [Acidimicrobiia bacterium]
MGRVALVTGAGRGIGRAIAEHLAGLGHRVAVNYRVSAAEAERVATSIRETGGEAVAVGADVSDEAAVGELFVAVEERLGSVEILVNNAGITRDGLLLRMSADDWDAVLAADLRSAYLCTRAALRAMVRARWGRIISIGSVAGLAGNAGQANYAAAKAGLVGFTKAVAREVGSRGITANVVAPGFVETDMTAALGEEAREAARRAIALGRFGTPQEVAAAVGYLASGPAAYITGQVIVVDGGMAL